MIKYRAFLLITCLFTVTAFAQKSALDYNSEGHEYLQQGKYGEAVWCFDKAIEIARNASFFANRAYAHHKLAMDDEALNDYFEAIKCDPSVGKYHFSVGNIYLDRKDSTLALDHFSKAINLSPLEYKYYFKRAGILYSQKKYDLSISDYEKVVKLEPNNYQAYMNLGFAYFMTERNNSGLVMNMYSEDACNCWKKAAANGFPKANTQIKAYCENNQQIYINKISEPDIYLFKMNGQKATIIELVSKDSHVNLMSLIETDPPLIDYLINRKVYPPDVLKDSIEGDVRVNTIFSDKGILINSFISSGNSIHPLLDAEALRLIQGMPSLNMDSYIWNGDLELEFTIPFSLSKDIEYEEIQKEIDWRILFNTGYSYMSSGKLNEAIVQFTLALDLIPNHINTLYNRGVCYFKYEKYTEGCNDFSTITELGDPEAKLVFNSICNNDSLTSMYLKDGLKYYSKGDNKSATSCFTNACEIDVKNNEACCYAAIVLLRQELSDSAFLYWNSTVDINKAKAIQQICRIGTEAETRELFSRSAKLNINNRDYQEAIDWYSEILSKYPNDADIYLARAEAYYIMGKPEKSCKDLNLARKHNKNVPESLSQKYCE